MLLSENSTAGRWTPEEHQKFLLGIMYPLLVLGLELFGKNWKKIQEIVPTRNGSQIRSHAQKHFLKLKKSGNSSYNPFSDLKSKSEEVQTPVQRNYPYPQEKQVDHSYFMSIMYFFAQLSVKYAKNHMNFDLWDSLIDDGTHKQAVTQIDSFPVEESSGKEYFDRVGKEESRIKKAGK